MASSVNLVLAVVFFVEDTVTVKLEKYINSDNLISKSLGYSLESKSVRMLTESLLTKEYLDLYKEMLKLSEDDEPYSHVKSRNVLMPNEKARGRDNRRRRHGNTFELIAHRRNKYQAARRDRLVRQSQGHKRRSSKHMNHTVHKHKMHHVHKKQESTTSSV